MTEITVAGEDGRGAVRITLPAYMPVVGRAPGVSEFVVLPTESGPAVLLSAGEEVARRVARVVQRDRGKAYRIADAAELRRVLTVAGEQTGAGHVGIDLDPGTADGRPGRLARIADVLDAARG